MRFAPRIARLRFDDFFVIVVSKTVSSVDFLDSLDSLDFACSRAGVDIVAFFFVPTLWMVFFRSDSVASQSTPDYLSSGSSVKISAKPLKRYVRTITGVELWSVDG